MRKKIPKNIRIVFILMLIRAFLWVDFVYSLPAFNTLRVPSIFIAGGKSREAFIHIRKIEPDKFGLYANLFRKITEEETSIWKKLLEEGSLPKNIPIAEF